MTEEIKALYAEAVERFDIATRLGREADQLQAQADAKRQESLNATRLAKQDFAAQMDKVVVVQDDLEYKPAIDMVSSEMLVVGIGGDHLLYWDGSNWHEVEPADESGSRHCAECGMTLVYREINLAPKGNMQDIPSAAL